MVKSWLIQIIIKNFYYDTLGKDVFVSVKIPPFMGFSVELFNCVILHTFYLQLL